MFYMETYKNPGEERWKIAIECMVIKWEKSC